MTQLERDNKQEYKILLDLLGRVNDAVDVSSISDAGELERLWDAHNLANQFIIHVLTILHLLDDTTVLVLPSFPPIKLVFVVSVSIDVLTRATMEAFLVFHYVFFAPTAIEEKDYRYWAYKAAGIAERQDLPETTYEHKHTKIEDKKALEQLCDKLKSNKVFQNLPGSQKARLFRGKEPNLWRWKPDVKKVLSWREIAIDAKFSEILASHMYRHLSGYAHSGSLSVLQTQQALINKDTQQLIGVSINASISTMNIVIANMIHEYCGLFPRSQDILTKDLKGSNLVKQYIQIGQRLDEH